MFNQWEWKKESKQEPNEIICHTLIAGNVLCRYWGDVEKSKEAKLIENANQLYDNLKKLREWNKEIFPGMPTPFDKKIDELLELIDKD